MAEQHDCRFVGSTSTLTKALSQIYFAISGGKGVDLATLSQDFASEANSAYDISKDRGYTQSYEREYYDLLRAGMLKFSLQVRIGGMDGIFLAYHNTSRIFGFQYVPLSEIDQRVFGSTDLAEQAFKISVSLLESLLHRCVAAFPNEPLDVIIKHTPKHDLHSVTAYIEPKNSTESPKPCQAITFTMQNLIDDKPVVGPVTFSGEAPNCQAIARKGMQQQRQDLLAMTCLWAPEGETAKSMKRNTPAADTPSIRWRDPGPRQLQLRKEAKDSGREYEKRKRSWKKGRVAWKV
ncbi:hypothetical protein CI109_102204 [Kwoniella shandongensis]|uniref:Uncharacterized protein n=1 Tax=Kwoniella shandongensis TaxID=1734106 RepID=A0AAJ8LFN7_9TREE